MDNARPSDLDMRARYKFRSLVNICPESACQPYCKLKPFLSPAVVVLVLALAWIAGLEPIAALILAATALGLLVSATGPIASIASRLPLLYVGIVLLTGYTSSLFLFTYLNRPELPATEWATGYLVVQWVAIAARFAISLHSHRLPKGRTRLTINPAGLVILAILSTIGIIAVAKNLSVEYFTNPQEARKSISLSVSPTMQTLYKCTITLTIGCAYYYLVRPTKNDRPPRLLQYLAVGALGVAALSLYGGRYLALSVIVGLFLLWIRQGGQVRWPIILVSGVLTYLTASAIAAYRYFSLYNISLSWNGIALTATSQASTEFLDGLEISASHRVSPELAFQTLSQELSGSIPSAVRGPLGIASYDTASMGQLASDVLRQTAVGGIRIGTLGEISLAFGIPGLVCLGLVLGILSATSAQLEITSGPATVLGIIASLLAVSVLVLGLGTMVSSIAVLAISCGLVRMGAKPAAE